MYKFIKIIGGEEYLDYLKKQGIYKYIPKKILFGLNNHISSRQVCSYKSRDTDKKVGLGLGLWLNKDKVSKDEYKLKIIETINNLKLEDEYAGIEYLIGDGLNLSIEDLEEVKDKADIKVPEGKELFAKSILGCLKKICKVKGDLLSEKEVLIISDDTKLTEDLINNLALSTNKFISIYSEDKELTDMLEIDILKKTGLSLNITRELGKSSENFDFIINLNEDMNLDIINIKKKNIVFDLSNSRCLASRASKSLRKIILIDDLFFKNDNNIYSTNGENEFSDLLNTSLSVMLNNTSRTIERIQIYGKILDIKSGINLWNLEKQNVSCFKKIE